MQIKDLAIGDGFVYLMEGSTKVKFYVLAHNYESGLNGKGRTLFCRESPATSGVHNVSKRDTYLVNNSGEDTWYKNTYVNKFSEEVRNLIGMTKYAGHYVRYYDHSSTGGGNGIALDGDTYKSSFFPYFGSGSRGIGLLRWLCAFLSRNQQDRQHSNPLRKRHLDEKSIYAHYIY